MKPTNSGWPWRGVDRNSMVRRPELHGCAACGSSTISTSRSSIGLRRDHRAGVLELGAVAVVEFVAVAMALADDIASVQPVRQRAGLEPLLLQARAHGAAEVGVLAAAFDFSLLCALFGDQPDHRVRWRGRSRCCWRRPARRRCGRRRLPPLPACRSRCRSTARPAHGRTSRSAPCPRSRGRRSRPGPGSRPPRPAAPRRPRAPRLPLRARPG